MDNTPIYQQVLQKCTVEGLTVKLPQGMLDRKTYEQVAKSLVGIGGKWKGGNTQGFVFATDPTELLNEIAGGAKRNLKKEFQFFETPDGLADLVVKLADLKTNDTICEPQAGTGALVKAIWRKMPRKLVFAFEIMEQNRNLLHELGVDLDVLGADFLQYQPLSTLFDKIMANPPFSNNQDIDHIYHMYKCLAPKGRLVSVASTHWCGSTNENEKSFRKWLQNVGATIMEVPAGTFKASGTNVASCIVIVDKK